MKADAIIPLMSREPKRALDVIAASFSCSSLLKPPAQACSSRLPKPRERPSKAGSNGESVFELFSDAFAAICRKKVGRKSHSGQCAES
jgi:hypothetical protein